MASIEVTELLGDGIGPELEQSVAAVAQALPVDLTFRKIDWSAERRDADGDSAIDAGVEAIEATRVALKYPTVTTTQSPNAVLRRRCNFSVIYRPAVTIPGIASNFSKNVNLHIVRVATGGTYEDPGQPIGRDAAVSIRLVERGPCEHAAAFAFQLARRHGWSVTSASKHTIQRITDGLFESVVSGVGERYPFVEHRSELFDALLAKILINPKAYQVILLLNEYGDFLSDMASGLVGSMGTGASGNFAFDADNAVALAMFDPAGGTAPDIAGQNKANPAAMLLAFAMLLDHIGRPDLGVRLQDAVHSAIADGECTADLGGRLNTTDFTATVVNRVT